jgi:hypothetical protein
MQTATRRHLLQIGGVSLLGLHLGQPLAASAARSSERNCIFIWLSGGPSQFETFDPKPGANDAVRGPYGAIGTSVPGTAFCELLPQLAQRADQLTVIRSLMHENAGHNSVAMAGGMEQTQTSFGAVVTKLRPSSATMPPYVHVGSYRSNGSIEYSGIDLVGGGVFGAAAEPLVIRHPVGQRVDLSEFTLQADVSGDRLVRRNDLVQAFDRLRFQTEGSKIVVEQALNYRRAVDVLMSTEVQSAFDLEREPTPLRQRYGANFFGQSCLLARRLVEAGTRYVQIKWYDCIAYDAWDVHGAELPGMSRMEQQLCPRFDQGMAALLDDLKQRGLLDSTLVVAVGEFGRTPQINQYGGRDHWPHCFSAVMAGGGAPSGTVIGSSDPKGAYPQHRPVKPEEFAATIYRQLGIDTINDLRVRPFIRDATALSEFDA